MRKYAALYHFYINQSNTTRELTLAFEKIEDIIADRLPGSAYAYRAWWANENDGNHVHAHSWMNAGWKVETLNQSNRWVRFIRVRK